MKVYIKNVIISNIDDSATYEKILEFKILGKLKSGREIQILDEELFDLRKYEKQWVECLIYGEEGPEKEEFALKGIFVKNYKIPPEMVERLKIPPNLINLGISKEKYLSINGRPAIKTQDGIFFIYPKKRYRDQSNITYHISKYELSAWYSIEK